MLSLDEAIRCSRERVQIYRLFISLLIKQPSVEIAHDFYKAFKPQIELESGLVMDKGIDYLNQFCKELENQEVSLVTTSLRVDWLRLFRGIKPNYGLPPARASAYTSYNIHSLLEVYAIAGVAMVDTQFEPDYVGIQLAFLYKLVSQELDFWNQENPIKALEVLSQENIFIQEHLSWITELCHQGVKHSETSFFKGMLFLLDEFIQSEQLWLEEYLNIACYSLG